MTRLASDMRRAIAERRVSAVDLVEDAFRRIELREHDVRAFAHLDGDWALKQAAERDRIPAAGPLHGIPFAVKDIFDTTDFATEYNSPIFRGHRPVHDAECVARARAAGAVLIGKTVTSEFAHLVLGPTRNPVDIRYSPGGSSSGSAAVVAAGFVPLALGTQTGGSIIRPASYCGVYGFKPTFGRLPTQGIKLLSPALDTVGLFANSVPDLELFFGALAMATPVASTAGQAAAIAVCRSSRWGTIDPCADAVLTDVTECLALHDYDISMLELPTDFDALPTACLTLLNAELARSLESEYINYRAQLSEQICNAIEAGQEVTAAELGEIDDLRRTCSSDLDSWFESFDAILTFSARGEAPLVGADGDSVFNRPWTMLQVPCLNIPAGRGPNQLPIGVQLIGRRARDMELLALARELSVCISHGMPHRSKRNHEVI